MSNWINTKNNSNVSPPPIKKPKFDLNNSTQEKLADSSMSDPLNPSNKVKNFSMNVKGTLTLKFVDGEKLPVSSAAGQLSSSGMVSSVGQSAQQSQRPLPAGSGAENGEMNGTSQHMEGDFDTNLYSRQLYTFGETAMRRLRCSRLLVSGFSGLGVEIAKNLILAGIRHVTIHDTKPVVYNDLSSQYYLTEKSVGQNRASVCHSCLVELNDSVTVECHTEPLTEEFVQRFDVVVLTDFTLEEQLKINEWTRAAGKKFISADCFGLVGSIFNDFNTEHLIEDPNGENCVEFFIEHIDKATGDVICLEEMRHNLQNGDHVTFSEVKGMTELNGCAPRQVRIINPVKFNVGDLSGFSTYKEGGKAKQVKVPFTISHKSMAQSIEEPEFLISDFAKMDRPNQFHIFLQALHKFRHENGHLPKSYDSSMVHTLRSDADKVYGLAEAKNSSTKAKVEKLDKKLCDTLCFTARGNLCPMAGLIGGIAAQETVKAITSKYTPLKQWFYFDAFECLPDSHSPFSGLNSKICAPKNSRYDGQAAVFGWNFQEALGKQNWFLVGTGAIGCELMKNFAMIGLACGSGGKITVTDMDQIEISNLNRQFLFRRNNVGSKKSTVAANAAHGFNSQLKVTPMCERVGGDTEQIFDDNFFDSLHGVANALDNVEARTYMDRRCVFYRKPLLETGTLGPKGNTQVVYPFLTESYSSSQDPPEKSIPICTVKHFPNQIEHTIQWARELFTGLFTNPAETANQFIEDPRLFYERLEKMHAGQKYDMLNAVKKVLIDDRPVSADQCIEWARRLLDESFDWDIRQLLHNFPVDQVTSHGVKFWSGTKRCPHALTFDPNNAEHVKFVLAASVLRAHMYNLKPSEDPSHVAKVAGGTKLPTFTPKSGVVIAVSDADLQQAADANYDANRLQELNLSLAKLKLDKSHRLSPVDFEKDDDSNYHVDFITCASNLRAENYSIQKADKLKTKQIAGKIIPAIATTTAAVAGLDCLELYKIVMGDGKCKLDYFKNGFLELELPFVAFAEPIRAPKKKYYDTEWTLWDRFEIQGHMTLQQLFDHMMTNYKLEISMLSHGVCILYSFFMPAAKRQERLQMNIEKLIESTSGRPIPNHVKSLVLEPMCSDDKGEDVEVPYINYTLPLKG